MEPICLRLWMKFSLTTFRKIRLSRGSISAAPQASSGCIQVCALNCLSHHQCQPFLNIPPMPVASRHHQQSCRLTFGSFTATDNAANSVAVWKRVCVWETEGVISRFVTVLYSSATLFISPLSGHQLSMCPFVQPIWHLLLPLSPSQGSSGHRTSTASSPLTAGTEIGKWKITLLRVSGTRHPSKHPSTVAFVSVLSFHVPGKLAAICSFLRLFGPLSTSNEERRQSVRKVFLSNFSAFQISDNLALVHIIFSPWMQF